jgi:hypothetical protein
MTKTAAFAAALTVLASSAALASSAQAQTVPVINFNGDWSVTQTAPLVAGQQAILRYDINRLPQCRATYNGLPAWAIAGGFQADSSSIVHNPVVTTGNYATNPIDVPITVPYGADLAVWFHNSDEWGCSTWDSNYSQNFHFAIQGPPTIHFNVDWTNAGQSFAVDYDIRRLPQCRAVYNGYDAWDVTVFYRFDGGTIVSAQVTAPISAYQKGPSPAVITAPAGAHTVEMWFEVTDYTGCTAWDSRYGQNFSFGLQ